MAPVLKTWVLRLGAAALLLLVGFLAGRMSRTPPPAPTPVPAQVSLLQPERAFAPPGWPCVHVARPGRATEEGLGLPTAEWRSETVRFPSSVEGPQGTEERVGAAVIGTAPSGTQIVYEVQGDTCQEWLNGERMLPWRCHFAADLAARPPHLVETCEQRGSGGALLSRKELVHPLPPNTPTLGVETSWDVSRSVVETAGERLPDDPGIPAPEGWPCTKLSASAQAPGRELTQPIFQGTLEGREFVVAAGRGTVEVFERFPDGFCNAVWTTSRESGDCHVRLLKPAGAKVAVDYTCKLPSAVPSCVSHRVVWRERASFEVGRAEGGNDPCAALESGPSPQTLIAPSEPLPPIERE